MLIDMHIHTTRYSNCAQMDPDAMARTAIARGLDGVVITEHDILWSRDEIEALQARHPDLTILRGLEISTEAGHALVYGVNRDDAAGFSYHMRLERLSGLVHEAGGLVVLAHPARYDSRIPRAVYRANLDGLEVRSFNIRVYMQQPIEALQAELALPGIAGTDGHLTSVLGLYATDFAAAIETEADLVAAVKAGAFTLHTDPARIRLFNAQISDPLDRLLHANGAGPE